MDTFIVPIETRASESGPRVRATIIQEGRVAQGGRSELFAPGSLTWPENGIEIRTVHLGPAETRGVPERLPDGRIVVEAPATPAIFAGRAGRRTFRQHRVSFGGRNPGGRRPRGNVGAVGRRGAGAGSPEYGQTGVEVRSPAMRRCGKRRVAPVTGVGIGGRGIGAGTVAPATVHA